MVETHWATLADRELRYRDGTWRLTGDVEVRRSGELLGVRAKRVDGVRHETATLYFGLEDSPGSLNPGNMGESFERLERTEDGQYVVVEQGRRTYRYELHRMEYE
jgi:hypothetical protein